MARDELPNDERLRRLEAAEEIRALLLEYTRCLDAGDYAAYAELFTEDGVLDAQLGQAQGREAIRALLERRLDGDGDRPRRKSFHVIATPTITVERESATSEVVWSYVTHDADGYPLILQVGHYRDELALEDGRWRFRRRTITRDLGYSPLELPVGRER